MPRQACSVAGWEGLGPGGGRQPVWQAWQAWQGGQAAWQALEKCGQLTPVGQALRHCCQLAAAGQVLQPALRQLQRHRGRRGCWGSL